MDSFEDIHRRHITGSLAMFDRMIFKGHLSHLFKPDAVRALLWAQGYPITDFTEYAKATTNRIAGNVDRLAAESGRPRISFDHVKTRNRTQMKDDLAKSIAEDDGITEGIVCFISAVEPCMSFQVRKSHETHRIEVTRRERKCLHHYMYLIDPEFGFMHVRIQGWIPYEIQIYINGREWLARQLDKAGVGYVRYETRSRPSRTSSVLPNCATASPIEPGPGCSTPSPDASTPSWPPSPVPASAATTGCSTRPRSPPTSCSAPAPSSWRCGPTWSTTRP